MDFTFYYQFAPRWGRIIEIFHFPQVPSLWSVTQRLYIIGRLQRPNNLLNPPPYTLLHHAPHSLFPVPYSLHTTP